MVGQAAEGLGADDVLIPGAHQLQHFRRQQPSLAHLAAHADGVALLRQLDQLTEGHGGMVSMILQGLDNHLFHAGDQRQRRLGSCLFHRGTAVQPDGLRHIVGAVLHKAHQPRQVHLTVLRSQKLFQIVVAEGGILDIDLPYHADLHLRHPLYGDGRKLRRDFGHGGFHLPAGVALSVSDFFAEDIQPFALYPLRRAFFQLIRLSLRPEGHQQVAVVNRRQRLPHEFQVHGHTAVLLQTGEVQAQHRDLPVPRLFQRFPQQENIVGCPAAAAGLGNDEGRVIQIVLAGIQRVQKLADDQQRRIASVVMDIFQSQLRHPLAAVAQQLHLIAMVLHAGCQNAELHRCHIGNENFMGLFHVRCKPGIGLFHIRSPPVPPTPQTGSASEYAPRPDW